MSVVYQPRRERHLALTALSVTVLLLACVVGALVGQLTPEGSLIAPVCSCECQPASGSSQGGLMEQERSEQPEGVRGVVR